MASRAKRILAAMNDPGGTQALVPVLEALAASSSHKLEILAAPLAEPLLASRGFSWQRESVALGRERAAELFGQYRPTLLLTGTSWRSNLEQGLRNQAMGAGVSSVVVLDFWSNYALRWHGSAYAVKSLVDTVCVPDEWAIREMVAAGFPENRLVVTGQPFIEEMFRQGVDNGMKGQAGRYLFLSQPSVVDGETLFQAQHIEVVVKALKSIAKARRIPVTLKIKLHPKEKESSLMQRIVSQLTDQDCTVGIAGSHQSVDSYIEEAECVIGYHTMALFQARALGKRVVSLTVYERGEGLRQAMRTAGIVDAPVDMNGLRSLFAGDAGLDFCKDFHHGATQNVLDVINGHRHG